QRTEVMNKFAGPRIDAAHGLGPPASNVKDCKTELRAALVVVPTQSSQRFQRNRVRPDRGQLEPVDRLIDLLSQASKFGGSLRLAGSLRLGASGYVQTHQRHQEYEGVHVSNHGYSPTF